MIYGEKNAVLREIKNQLRANMTLLKFLYYVNVTDKDILILPDLTSEQVRDTVDKCIFNYPKLEANKAADMGCYICLNYGTKQYHYEDNKYFNGNTFDIYIICDRDIDFNTVNGSRIYAIEDCIAGTFDPGEVSAIGLSRVEYSEPVAVRGTNYIGVHIALSFFDKPRW